jgi:protease IV
MALSADAGLYVDGAGNLVRHWIKRKSRRSEPDFFEVKEVGSLRDSSRRSLRTGVPVESLSTSQACRGESAGLGLGAMDENASTGMPTGPGSGTPLSSTTPPASPPPVPPIITAPAASTPPPPKRNGNGWKVVAIIAIILLGFIFLGNVVRWTTRAMRPGKQTYERLQKVEEVTVEQGSSDNKIAVIEVEGIIMGNSERSQMSMPQFIREQLKAAKRDEDVKAVILKINSPGGEVMAADEIHAAIEEFQTNSHKPVIASMGTLAASGGYYVAAPCRWIVANELTITGSIGVIMHGYNVRGLMNKLGVTPEIYKSGKFKDMLSPDQEPDLSKLSESERATRTEEKKMVQDLIDETFKRFKEVVKTGRDFAEKKNNGEGRTLSDDWADYADGRVFSGKQAYELGFVDEKGNFEVAVKRAKALAKIRDASLIEYRQPFDFSSLFHLLGKSEAPALKVDLGINIPKLHAGQLYYIFPGVLN